MRVVSTRRALDDRAGIAASPRPLEPRAAVRVGRAIRAAVRRIARRPSSGRLQQDGSWKVVVLPYGHLVFHDRAAGSIEVLTIQHGARSRATEDA